VGKAKYLRQTKNKAGNKERTDSLNSIDILRYNIETTRIL